MKSNTEQIKIAEKYLGEKCNACCSMSNNCCCYFVCKIFKEATNASLFYGGQTVTYCPNAIKWCKANLAEIPPYLAMPSDVIFFDWQPNGIPDHIGFVYQRISDQEILTLEGNTTSRYVVAKQTRTVKYVQGIFRPHFKPTSFSTDKALAVDGQFDYNSIACLQKVLGVKVDAILGRDTVKALQKKVSVTQDGAWGVNTSKAVQKMVGATVDGAFGEKSVKALQTWINTQMGKTTTNTDKTPSEKPQTPSQPSDGKLTIDGAGGTLTVKALQKFLGTTEDGVISGQKKDLAKYYPALEAVEFGGKGSTAVRYLQKWLGIAEDGIWGQGTSKALQKKLGVTQDGIFGTNSMKALQKYLNEHDKAVYPQKTNAQKIVDKARELAWPVGTAESKYKYDGGSPTSLFKTALNKVYPSRSSWGEAPRKGAACDVFTGVVVNSAGIGISDYPRGLDQQIKYSNSKFQKLVYKNVTPYSVSQDGDIIMYYKKADGSSKHTVIRGDGVIYEAQLKLTYGHVNKAVKTKLNVKRPYVVILRAK